MVIRNVCRISVTSMLACRSSRWPCACLEGARVALAREARSRPAALDGGRWRTRLDGAVVRLIARRCRMGIWTSMTRASRRECQGPLVESDRRQARRVAGKNTGRASCRRTLRTRRALRSLAHPRASARAISYSPCARTHVYSEAAREVRASCGAGLCPGEAGSIAGSTGIFDGSFTRSARRRSRA